MSAQIKANIVRPASMDSEALGQYVAEQTLGILRRTEELRPLYVELWKRFGKLNKGESICGCRNRTEYCEKILHRTIRSVQHVLRGPRKPSLVSKEDFKEQLGHYDRADIKDLVPEDIREEDDESRYEKRRAEQEVWDKEHPEKAAERKRKADEKANERREASERKWAEFDQRHPTKTKPPAEDIRAFASLGRQRAAQKYHNQGQYDERMVQMNQVADWLESLASAA